MKRTLEEMEFKCAIEIKTEARKQTYMTYGPRDFMQPVRRGGGSFPSFPARGCGCPACETGQLRLSSIERQEEHEDRWKERSCFPSTPAQEEIEGETRRYSLQQRRDFEEFREEIRISSLQQRRAFEEFKEETRRSSLQQRRAFEEEMRRAFIEEKKQIQEEMRRALIKQKREIEEETETALTAVMTTLLKQGRQIETLQTKNNHPEEELRNSEQYFFSKHPAQFWKTLLKILLQLFILFVCMNHTRYRIDNKHLRPH